MLWSRIALGALSMALSACGPVLPPADAALVVIANNRWPDATLAQLDQGRALYLTRCTTCHVLRDPAAYAVADWSYYLTVMAPRAQLTEPDRHAVERYLVAAHDLASAGSAAVQK